LDQNIYKKFLDRDWEKISGEKNVPQRIKTRENKGGIDALKKEKPLLRGPPFL
jgi:hypothetical protein